MTQLSMLRGWQKGALVSRLVAWRKVWHGLANSSRTLASLFFYNRKHHIAKQQHAVERTRELFAKSLGYSKPQTQGDYAIAQHFLTNLPTDAGEYAVFFMRRPVMINTGRKNTGEN